MSVHSVDSFHPIYSDESTWILVQVGYPIRKSPDQRLFAPTRGLSQLITSFIVSMCLGIPRTPLVALPKCFFLEDDLATLNHRTGDSIFPISKLSKSNKICVELTGIEPATS